ncbi:MAG: putative lipid II flippase FtsW [Candidatus Schekmanbacteria bacterium]|nr:putative lipid II flippase FtsW [Candidatus Schekmanbacteria bacterium]
MRYRLLFCGKALLISTLLLSAIGAVMVYSASLPLAQGQYQDGYFFLRRHLIRLGLGLLAMLCTWWIVRSRRINLRYFAYPLTLISLALLWAVLYSPLGVKIRGAQRWLSFRGFLFQPVELAKLGLVFCLAHLAAKSQEREDKGLYFLGLAGGMMSAVLFFVVRQPDLGNTLLLGSITFIFFFLARVHLVYLLSLGLIAVSTAGLWLTRYPYVQKRLAAFIDPWQHAADGGFQTVQSYLALGNGGLWGLGLGAGRQKWGYLPEAYSDFILAVIGEELGLIGAGLVIIGFFILIWAGFKIAAASADLFTGYLCAGIISIIGLQAFLNIWVVIGLFPNKGLPLPFISYGGTSLVANLIGIGILLAYATEKTGLRPEA